jgi:hypothetical protein
MAIKRLLTPKGAALTTALIVGVAVCGYYLAHNNQENSPSPTGSLTSAKRTTDQKDDINSSPPTAEEKAQADAQKDQNISRANDEKAAGQSTSNSKRSVTPVITNKNPGDPVTISGYVSGVFEDGGVCTATLTQNGKTVTATSQGFKNVSTTNCAPISIARSQLPGGTWQVSLSYSSAAAEGTSGVQAWQL